MAEPTDNPWGLTARETEVLGLLKEIGHAKGVAEALGISARTVEEHLANIRRKMVVETTMQSMLEYHAWLVKRLGSSIGEAEPSKEARRGVSVIAILAFALPVFAIVALLIKSRFAVPSVSTMEPNAPLVSESLVDRSDVLVSMRRGDSEDRDIALIDLNSGEISPITDNPAEDLESVWSPDGSKIAFASNRSGDFDIWVMNADGSNLIDVTDADGDQRFPSWSPDGKSIVYQSLREDSPNGDIYSCELSNFAILNVINAAGDDCQPSFSPSGKEVAFSSNRNGRYEIFVYDFSTKTTKQVSKIGGDSYCPNWSEDGRCLVYSSNADGNWEIYVVEVSNSKSRRLTNRINAPDGSPTLYRSKVLWDSTENGQSYLYEVRVYGNNARRIFWKEGVQISHPKWRPQRKNQG